MASSPRFLVTGGAGFIGSNLVLALVAAGERVRVLDNLSTGCWEHLERVAQSPAVERLEGDIRDANLVAKATSGIEVILHQAALGSVPRSVELPIESNAVNVGGTVTLLDVARHQGVRRIVFASSSSVYGETPVLPKHEDMAPMPLSPYAISKLAGEHYMKVFASIYGIETVSLRYFNVFGPNQTPSGVYAAAIPRFIDAALAAQPIRIFGDGRQTRDFCYVDNVVQANLLAAATGRKLSGQVVNIAGGRRVVLGDLCREIARCMGRELAIEHVAPRAGDVRHSLADIARAQKLLGYQPRVAWEQGLVPTIAYLQSLRARTSRAASVASDGPCEA